jgi:integrase
MTPCEGTRLRQRTERLLAGSRWHDDSRDLVFRTTVGTPMDGIAVTRRYQAILRDAGLPRQRFHDLRHACATPAHRSSLPKASRRGW